MTCHTYLCVGSYLFVWGQGGGGGIEMVRQECCHYVTKHSTSLCAKLTFPTCHSAVWPLTCAPLMVFAEVQTIKSSHKCLYLFTMNRPAFAAVKLPVCGTFKNSFQKLFLVFSFIEMMRNVQNKRLILLCLIFYRS